MTPDVNVLVAASRNNHPHHAVPVTGWFVLWPHAAKRPIRFAQKQPKVLADTMK
jgi:hypothetical protein